MKKSYYHIGIILFLAFWVGFFSGCSSKEVDQKTKQQIDLKKAKDFQRAGRYDLALERYQEIKNKYPLSPEAVEAELEIAETMYLSSNFIESLAYFQSFQDLHPTHPQSDFVAFRIGMNYFKQLPSTIDRDLSQAQKAIESFDRFLAAYPKSTYKKEAEAMRKESLLKLAQKELYIAEFYLKRKKYQSALGRFDEILKMYKNVGLDDEALYYQGVCYYELNEKNKAKRTFNLLLLQFPQSKRATEAKVFLNKI
ncbi:MAG: outer membrane protein assembly factor BamD [Deltaproteobacteria bacterium]|nr:outer membrane protein assembly factor BamD [Deltaproteobacteria bacterium]